LPRGSSISLDPNPLFVGRQAELQQLARHFEANGASRIVTAALTGLGGTGKTQLAVEFVHRYGQYFAGVFWLNFADAAAVPAQVAACGGAGYLDLRPDFHTLDLDTQIPLVLSAWQSGLPYLLVFDNCDEGDGPALPEQLLAQWRPKTGACRVLVTSRRAEFDATLGVLAVPVQALPREDSLALLRQYRPDLSVDDLAIKAIADLVGDLPLALHLAGSYLRECKDDIKPEEYVAEFKTMPLLDHESLRAADGVSPTKHLQTVHGTFALSFRRLDTHHPVDELALALLARAAYFAPGELIPRGLLRTTVAGPPLALQFARAVRRLVNLGLWVSETTGALHLHPLLVQFVREMIRDTHARADVERALAREYDRLRANLPSGVQRTGEMTEVVALARSFATQAHYGGDDIRRLFDTGSEGNRIVALSILGTAFNKACFDLIVVAIRSSKSAFEQFQALVVALNMLDLMDAEQKTALTRVLINREGNVAYIGNDTSRLIIMSRILKQTQGLDAIAIYPNSLAILPRDKAGDHAIREQELRSERPDTVTRLNKLIDIAYDQGDYGALWPLLERALVLMEGAVGLKYPYTAESLNLLSRLPDEAQYYGGFWQALTIWQRVLGLAHPDTGFIPDNVVVSLLQAQASYGLAQPLLERALVITQRTLGPANRTTVTIVTYLIKLLRHQGDNPAWPVLELALAIAEQVLGPEHLAQARGSFLLLPEHIALARGSVRLVLVPYAQWDDAAARSLYEWALAISEQVLGPEHPDTAVNLGTLALLLLKEGDYAGARSLFERALAIWEQVREPEDSYTAANLSTLALLLLKEGDYAGARSLLERALPIWQRVLELADPFLLYAQGDHDAARLFLEEPLLIWEKVLGPEHPDTATVRNNLATLLRVQRDDQAASPS
jgi:tetratricopeptide (TPR) repeat protein